MSKRTNRRPVKRSSPNQPTGVFDHPYFRTVWESTREAMVLSDPDGIVLAANPAYLQLYELPAEAVIGQSFARIFPEAARPQALQQYKEVFNSTDHLPHVATRCLAADDNAYFEATVQQADGGVRTVESRIAFIDEGGQRVAMLSIIRDITERKQAEAALQESEARLRAIYDGTYEYIGLLTPEGTLLEANRALLEFAHNTRADVVGRPFWEISWFTHSPEAPQLLRQAIRQAAAGEFIRYEVAARRPTGEQMTFDFSLYPIRNEQGEVVFIVPEGRDITERKQAEAALQRAQAELEARVQERTRDLQQVNRRLQAEIAERQQVELALRESETQLRTLASRLTMAEQAERQRISQILHDDLQQRLYGVRMLLQVVIEETEANAESELATYAQQAYELLGNTVGMARQLTVDLSPPVLQEEGLVDMLQWLAVQMARVNGFQVAVQAAHHFPIQDTGIRVLLYQCVRELLFNVVKHSQTNQATVALVDGKDGHLQIQVSDAGRGFDVETAEARHADGFGLFSVRERLALFGGRMTIHSAPGQGTRTHIDIQVGPLP